LKRVAKPPIRVLLVEDESLYRDLLKHTLLQYPQFQVVGDFGKAEEALAVAVSLAPQVAILDIDLGEGANGVQLGLALRQQMPHLGVVLLSNHADPQFLSAVPRQAIAGWSHLQKKSVRNVETVARAVEGAASGLVVLDEEIITRRANRSGARLGALSARHREVLALIAQGYSNSAIAAKLVITEKTVQNYVNRVYRQLDIVADDPVTHPRVRAALLYLE